MPAPNHRGGRRALGAKHERFAQLVALGKKPKEAYLEAGFIASKETVLRTMSYRLRRRMRERIAEIIGIDTGLAPRMLKNAAELSVVHQTIEAFQKDLPWCRDKLHELINDKDCPHATRLGAIKECLNRGLGLPIQYVEQNLNVRYQISDKELTEDEWFAQYAKPVVDAIPGPTGPTEH